MVGASHRRRHRHRLGFRYYGSRFLVESRHSFFSAPALPIEVNMSVKRMKSMRSMMALLEKLRKVLAAPTNMTRTLLEKNPTPPPRKTRKPQEKGRAKTRMRRRRTRFFEQRRRTSASFAGKAVVAPELRMSSKYVKGARSHSSGS